MYMEIYIIRHTAVAVEKDICYGQSDVDLAMSFADEVGMFEKALPKDFDAVYSSPLSRCKNLAKALGYQNIALDNALMEMNFGDWEMQKWNAIDAAKLQAWMDDFVNIKASNGENLLDVFARVENFITTLLAQNHKKVLIVTHAGIIRCFWAYILEIPLKNIFRIPVKHNEIFACQLNKDFSTIISTK